MARTIFALLAGLCLAACGVGAAAPGGEPPRERLSEQEAEHRIEGGDMQSGNGKDMCDPAVAEAVHGGSFYIVGVAGVHGVDYGRRIGTEIAEIEFAHGRIYAAEQRKAVFRFKPVHR